MIPCCVISFLINYSKQSSRGSFTLNIHELWLRLFGGAASLGEKNWSRGKFMWSLPLVSWIEFILRPEKKSPNKRK